MEQEKIRFSVTVGQKDLYRFLIYNAYHNMQGMASVFISLLAWAILILKWQTASVRIKLILAVLGLFYLAYMPIHLWLRAKRQAASEVFSKPLDFEFSEEEIRISQGEEEAALPWENVYKIVSRKRDLYLYTNRIYAYTIPKEQAGEAWRKALVMADGHHCRITS